MSLSTFLTSSSTPQRVNWETAYFHKVVWVPCVVTWTQRSSEDLRAQVSETE